MSLASQVITSADAGSGSGAGAGGQNPRHTGFRLECTPVKTGAGMPTEISKRERRHRESILCVHVC